MSKGNAFSFCVEAGQIGLESRGDGSAWLQCPFDALYVSRRNDATREKLLYQKTFSPLQQIFILNQKAHYSTHRLTCPLYPAEM